MQIERGAAYFGGDACAYYRPATEKSISGLQKGSKFELFSRRM